MGDGDAHAVLFCHSGGMLEQRDAVLTAVNQYQRMVINSHGAYILGRLNSA
ncbi:hypothetical protein LNQ03_02275 [Klebsiella pneumoniae subsp. pneumoniae]|nr:hypothetical protein [Klebsiella pneumoniae subsp. pneumoniae]